MAILKSYDKEITSIFQLLGDKENDITLSMSWALSRCPEFLKAVVVSITGVTIDPDDAVIRNQAYDAQTGITDIEITDGKSVHIIFEAKRGWELPKADQLTRYSLRNDFQNSPVANKYIVSMSECTKVYADLYLPFHIKNGIPVAHLPYSEVYQLTLATVATSNNEQKHLLTQFTDYLRGLMSMQNQTNNMVYVVSLGAGKPDGCSLSWIDIVKQHNKYFCPVGGSGWPKEPPNYIAFRYNGQLQAIHHIEAYSVRRNMHDEIPEMPDKVWDTNHFIYHLGPAIVPSKTVKTGKIYQSTKVWVMLDTLLTCDTISDALDETKARLK